jgi:hypothetical protein
MPECAEFVLDSNLRLLGILALGEELKGDDIPVVVEVAVVV